MPIFKREYKEHIIELGQSLDKIFLVYTKINALSGNKLEQLQERIKEDFQRYGLYDKVAEKIYFISAEESLDVRLKKKKGIDSVQKLENDIWTFLLKENKIGLVNLSSVCKEIINSTNDFEGILNARLLDDKKRKKLMAAIEKVSHKVPELLKLYGTRESDIRKGLKNSIENKKNQLLIEFERYLKSFSANEDLPNKKALQLYLSQGCHKTLDSTNIEYSHQVNLLKELIDDWIENNLKQVREIITKNPEKKFIDFSEVENFEAPKIDFTTSFGVAFFTGIIGLFINPPVGFLTAVSGFLANLLFSSSERRAKQIEKIMNDARKCYNQQFKKIDSAYMELVTEHSKLIIDYANDKLKLFFSDLKNQAKGLNKELSKKEILRYENAFNEINDLRDKIKVLDQELQGLCFSI